MNKGDIITIKTKPAKRLSAAALRRLLLDLQDLHEHLDSKYCLHPACEYIRLVASCVSSEHRSITGKHL